MSKAKVIKPTKKVDWSKLKIYFRALFKNDAVKEIGLTKSIYIGAIAAILSVIISVVPLVVHTSQTNGSDFLNGSAVYNFDEAFYDFLLDAKENKYEIRFNHQDKTATLEGKTTEPTNNYLLYSHTYKASDGHDISRVDFQAYYVPNTIDFQTAFNSISTEITNQTIQARDASYVIFGYEGFAAALYKYGTSKFVNGVSGNYRSVSEEYSKLSDFLITNQPTYISNLSATLDKFKPFLDQCYKEGKRQMVLVQFGLGVALNSAITLLMGFVLWLLTRGKNNPNRGTKLSQTMNMAFWSTITPALIALIVGFILHNSAYDLMIYIICFGFRAMWLSMKQLPSYQE